MRDTHQLKEITRIGKEITGSLILSSCSLSTFSIQRKNHQWQPSPTPTFYYPNPHLCTTACCCVPALLSCACNFNKDLSPFIWYPTLPQRTDSTWSKKSIKLMLSGLGGQGEMRQVFVPSTLCINLQRGNNCQGGSCTEKKPEDRGLRIASWTFGDNGVQLRKRQMPHCDVWTEVESARLIKQSLHFAECQGGLSRGIVFSGRLQRHGPIGESSQERGGGEQSEV